jgi:hypothetical protein
LKKWNFLGDYNKKLLFIVNRGISRTPSQHRVGDLGGTRQDSTADDDSRTEYSVPRTLTIYDRQYMGNTNNEATSI